MTGPLEAAIEAAVARGFAAHAEHDGPRAYSVAEVAERLKVSEATVYRLIKDGYLPTVPHLNPLRVATVTLDEFLAGKR
jgi:excisionase family DNA binding protein